MMTPDSELRFDVEVKRCYSAGANDVEFGLCCPAAYDAKSPRFLLAAIASRVIYWSVGLFT
jgi:hypothetical protein